MQLKEMNLYGCRRQRIHMFKKIKSLFCILLSIAIMSGMLTGCSASGNGTPSATKTQVTDTFKEAIQQGIAWEELAAKADKPVN